MIYLYLLFGCILLLFGRKFFWIFVGILGFIEGINLANRIFFDQPFWLQILFAVVLGLAGASLATILQRITLALAGFIAGGSFFVNILPTLGFPQTDQSLIVYIIGGLLGVVLILSLFDWALIILSSLTGSILIVQAVAAPTEASTVLLIALIAGGIAIQANIMRQDRSTQPIS